MTKLTIKTPAEIAIMAEGGRRLAEIRDEIIESIKPGVTGQELDRLADKLIEQAGGKPSFKMVRGYKWATCININDVVVHGIPNKIGVKAGDKVGVDIGMLYKGFHTDTSTTVIVNSNSNRKFLETGKMALKKAIEQAHVGKRISDISWAMQEVVEAAGYSVVKALTGHGIGKSLHEEPAIPCFVVGEEKHSPRIVPGMVLAIEVMYNEGDGGVVYKSDDGWTISTADGKISGLFEETVAVTNNGPVVLTTAKS